MVTKAVDAASDSRGEAAPSLHEYVRKTVGGEILVQEWCTYSPDSARPAAGPYPPDSTGTPTPAEHAVTVRWPRAHPFYMLPAGVTSPLLFTESVRQSLAVLTHEVHRIPLDHRLGWESLRCTVAPGALHRDTAPSAVHLRVGYLDVTHRRLGSVRATAHVDAVGGDGRPVGRAELRYITHPPAVYRRLRGGHADAARACAAALPPLPAVPAREVGRARQRDVVLAAAQDPYRWQLRLDTGHGVLFDHPHDHVPGMVQLEAAAQAVQAAAGTRAVLPVAFEAVFLRYAELDRPYGITVGRAAPDGAGRGRFLVEGVQDGRPVFSVRVTAAPLGEAWPGR